MLSFGRGNKELTSTYRPVIVPRRPDKQVVEQPQPQNDLGHKCSAVQRSSTAPASYGYVLPIAPAGSIAGSRSKEVVNYQGADAQPWVRTIHIHLDRDPPLTEVCRCLLDTGSDFNLISQRTLRTLELQFTAREEPTLTGIGGFQIFPIGSVVLTWHMDRYEKVAYHDTFLVISDDVRPLFDVLLGKDWIKKSKALLRNDKIMLARCLGENRALASVHGDA